MKRAAQIQPIVARLRGRLGLALRWLLGGCLVIALLYQVPVRQTVRLGLNDAAYVQGWSDPVNRWAVIDAASRAQAPLRWSTARSALIFPQIGLPAEATIRLRADPQLAHQTVEIWLNGRQRLATLDAGPQWSTHRLLINGGLLKANDLFLELRVTPTRMDEGQARGVQVDQVTLATRGWPILPYPAQVLYGGLALGLAALLLRTARQRWGALLLLGLLFLLCYRLHLGVLGMRTLPPLLVALLAALAGLRALPVLAQRLRRRLALAAGVALILAWLGWLLLIGRAHVGLSVPGVERDFPVFATRAEALTCPTGAWQTAPCVLRADGFYQLGYPLLLWLVKPLTGGDAFAAGKLIAAVSGALLLLLTLALGSRLLGAGAALLAVLCLAFSPFVVQYSLYVGTDMPFAALWLAALAALWLPQRVRWPQATLAGVLAGWAFLVRHPGLVLLPLGLIVLGRVGRAPATPPTARRWPWHIWGAFVLGWLIGVLPQLIVNLRDTGVLLYSQQAKNIWLAVYGNIDYGGRWAAASNDVRLSDLILADPARFFGNWARNLRLFFGTGAEDTSEFGQALALRLLHAPANLLALAGLAGWLWCGARWTRLLLLAAGLYLLGVSVGFLLLRFVLPLAPIWALAAAAATQHIAARLQGRARLGAAQWLALLSLVLVWAMSRGPQIGARYVLEHQSASRPSRGMDVALWIDNACKRRFVCHAPGPS